MDIFNFQDLTGEFSVLDVVLVLGLSFLLSAFIGWVYKLTHRGTSYTQSFVFTLVLNGMVVALVMMIVGSNIARAFSLVGALSIIRFRNAVKETRDVGFIFFTMAVGMAIGTRFYLLAVVAALVISAVIVLMMRFNWFAREAASQILRIQVPSGLSFDKLFDALFLKYSYSSELISVDTLAEGALVELTYSIGLKQANRIEEFVAELRKLNSNNKVSLIAGYNTTDL
ncbi:MAG: DUF4956 domain-containing protein [Anaerolineales bacterium]|jgi:uncharacterized membrane protein YhiD involved in acid resistance|nr:DUF4956 domain-containing protein [Anaerolineales bacterium]MBX3005078.1 DUF4956 domain-containing protein [Anaerolineales bacterium]MCW5839265.1 DUF4956 domain-containing protein [Anaerolineales bacterium]